jgi:ethanolamine utilization protein EutN
MQIGVVVGHATSTVKHRSLNGWRLLLVQMLAPDGKEDGEPLLVIDSLGAGVGSKVIATNDGASARQAVGDRTSPVRWMVLGLTDG